MPRPAKPQKVRDAQFLVEEFGMTPPAAADLLAEPLTPEAAKVADAVRDIERRKDPLAGVPAPKSGEDHPAHSEDGGLKPVVRNNDWTAS